MARLLAKTEKGVGGVLGVLAVTALGAYAMHSAVRHAHLAFAIRASPSRLTVTAGSTARYGIAIHRNRIHGKLFTGRVRLRVRGLPRHAQSRISFARRSRSKATLIVATSTLTRAGRYTLRLRGRSGRSSATIRLKLSVSRPTPVSLGISGTVTGLVPGAPEALNLSVSNPSGGAISVTDLTVSVQSISARRATAALPCTPTDFFVQQFSGSYPLALPPSSTRTLAALGVSPANQPHVMLLDRPVDQDGCQGATLTLAYTGTAQAG